MTTTKTKAAGERLSALGHPGYSDEFAARVLALVQKTECSTMMAVASCLQTDHQLRWLAR